MTAWYEKSKLAMEKRLGCRFCEDGKFAEMGMDLADYEEKTTPIEGVSYGFFQGDMQLLREAVAQVDATWVEFYPDGTDVFAGFVSGKPVCFCIVEEDKECMLAEPGVKVGSIGCVGTLPEYRGRQLGLRMVDLATLYLKQQGFDKGYIHYTAIDHWYAKLGYETFARFSFCKEDGEA